jgi:hypothetical protein
MAIILCICSICAWVSVQKFQADHYDVLRSQNKAMHTKTILLHTLIENLNLRANIVQKDIGNLQAIVAQSADNDAVFHFNPSFKTVSVEEETMGIRVGVYRIKIGERPLFEYIADRYTPKNDEEVKSRVSLYKSNLESIVAGGKYTAAIHTIKVNDKEYIGMMNNLVVFSVTETDALHLQVSIDKLAETYKKKLSEEMLIAKENDLFQRTPLTGKIKTANNNSTLPNLCEDIDRGIQSTNTILNDNADKVADLYGKVMIFKSNYAMTPSIYPIVYQEITSPYGYRRHPITGRLTLHSGLDMVAWPGSKVKATADGRVVSSGWMGGYGNAVKINHGMGVSTIYGHCSALLVAKGTYVRKGQVIALSGDSGLSAGPHLHYEVRRWDVPIDPTPYLNRTILTAKTQW